MERATAREAELGGPLPHLTELGVDEADLRAYGAGNDARTSNTVLQAAKSHRTSTAQVAMLRERPELSACAQDGALGVPRPCRAAQECWSQCAREAKCEMWVWCGHKAGCDDAGAFNGVYPHHGCQLMQLPKVRDPSGCAGVWLRPRGRSAAVNLCASARRGWTRRCGTAGRCSPRSSPATSTVCPRSMPSCRVAQPALCTRPDGWGAARQGTPRARSAAGRARASASPWSQACPPRPAPTPTATTSWASPCATSRTTRACTATSCT